MEGDGVDIEGFRLLLGPEGRELLATADLTGDPLAVAARLRRSHPADLVSAVLTQAALRARAAERFGADAARMYFTPAGLEQASRAEVAAHRAARFARADLRPGDRTLGHPGERTDLHPGNGALRRPAERTDLHPGDRAVGRPEERADSRAGGRGDPRPRGRTDARLADLCCGIGADMIALARNGIHVTGVDADPLTVEVARANLEALGLDEVAEVRLGDAEAVDPAEFAAVFCDPARRRAGGATGGRGPRGRVFDPASFSPPWPEALRLAGGARGGCVKTAPGIPHELVPPGAEAEWVSYKGDVKEAAIWLGDLATAGTLPPSSATNGSTDTAAPSSSGTASGAPQVGRAGEADGSSRAGAAHLSGNAGATDGAGSASAADGAGRTGAASGSGSAGEASGSGRTGPADGAGRTGVAGGANVAGSGGVARGGAGVGAGGFGRRATLLPSGATLTAEPGLGDPAVSRPLRYLYEPDGAVVRAHLVAEAAAAVGGALLDPRIAYITGDSAVDTPFCTRYEVLDVMQFSLKRLRSALRARRAGTVTVKKRGSAVDVERLRRDLRAEGPESVTVVLTRIGERPYALICRPA